jgi:hypothetical protein
MIVKKNIEDKISYSHNDLSIIFSLFEMYGGFSKTIEFLYMSYGYRKIFEEIYSVEYDKNFSMNLNLIDKLRLEIEDDKSRRQKATLKNSDTGKSLVNPSGFQNLSRMDAQISSNLVSNVDRNALFKAASASAISRGRPRSTRLVTPK